jgi:hypothetical protein
MFKPQQRYTGTQYTFTAALLALAFLFSPALLILSRPVGLFSASLAIAGSALCVIFAWFNWNRHSELTITSIRSRRTR